MSKKILLVEDDALIAMNGSPDAQKHGYDIVTAYNGEIAVETATSEARDHLNTKKRFFFLLF